MKKVRKIRFYEKWVYSIYVGIWTPILKERPDLCVVFNRQMNEFIKNTFDENVIKELEDCIND